MDKVNGIMNDLADMANFKNFGKEVETEEEILNADGSRNWQANILLDNVKRLEQENARLKEATNGLLKIQYTLAGSCKKYEQTLQEIKAIAEKLMADNLCNNCDGIGLDANCQDTGCPYYQMDRILDLITKAEEE